MLFCNQCRKSYPEDYKFCIICGSPLVKVSNHTHSKPQDNQIPTRKINASEIQPAALSSFGTEQKPKKGLLAVIGMFLINLIPVLGFLFSFLWARAQFKNRRLRLTAFTSAFIMLNITVTIFGYAAAVNLMKNSLSKAAEKQGALKAIHQWDSQAAAGSTGYTADFPGTYDIPMTDTSAANDTIPLPKEDEHGNMYMDLDNDGIAETIYCPDGVILPVKGSKIQEDGKRYVDENGDGNYEIFYDTDGSTYMDYDDNGTYDVLMKDGNIYYDLDGDGVYDQMFETEYGQE